MAIPTQFNINPSGEAGQPKWPRKRAVVFGVMQLQQLAQDANLTSPNGTTGLNTTLKFSMPWQRLLAGSYQNNTLEKYSPEMLYIQGQGNYFGQGNPAIPLLNGDAELSGYLTIYSDVWNTNKLALFINTFDLTGTLTDLFDLIGNTIIYLPEIRLYNAFIYPD